MSSESESLKVFCYSRCSTCRKALAWLDAEGIAYSVVDITSNPPTREQIKSAVNQLGDRKLLFNTSGKSYRSVGAAVIKAMTEDEALDALAADGRLIKRPFLQRSNGGVLVGFKADLWAETLKG